VVVVGNTRKLSMLEVAQFSKYLYRNHGNSVNRSLTETVIKKIKRLSLWVLTAHVTAIYTTIYLSTGLDVDLGKNS
jgi:hypothetical protein